MIDPGRGWRRDKGRWCREAGLSSTAFPGVETDVMMVSTRGDEGRAGAVALRELEAEHAAVKGQRALQIGHLQMNVADADSGMDRSAHDMAG
jgi:hypothetical protein